MRVSKTFSLAMIAMLAGSAGTAMAAAYRIPEQSVDSTAKAGAHVAHTTGADSSYFNPANMAWMEGGNHLEANLQYINLPSYTYSDNRSPLYNGESEEEDFLLPTLFYVSPEFGNARFGLSLTYPGGLRKRWEDPYPRTFAQEFELKVMEVNPTVSYRFGDRLSIGGGVRMLYSEGTVRSNGVISRDYGGVAASRDMDGDTTEFGYNLAMSLRLLDGLNLAATYRSNVDLDLEGDATLWTSADFAGPNTYGGGADVSVPLPAVFALALSYTWNDLTVELEYDRTYWSEYEYLDFSYDRPLLNPFLIRAFDRPTPKNWEDTDTYRIGMEYVVNPAFTLMAGFAVDENPIPDETVGFELPDSDALLYSVGLRYRVNEAIGLGIAYLYDDKDSRDVSNALMDGAIDDGGAHLVTAGLSWDF